MARRLIALTAVLAVCSFVVGSASAVAAEAKPAAGRFAEFRACMKAHGSPALTHRLSADERAAFKQAFAACRELLPKHRFVPPSAAQIAAFKTCMADKGFSSSRPNMRDPAVRKALMAALKVCLPLLKPKPSSNG